LMRKVPRSNLHNISHESSRFCNFLWNANNCYYCFGGWWSDNMYCTDVSNGIDVESSNCLDCLMCIGLNYSYWCIETHFSHKCIWCYNCEMLYYCINCYDCVRCEFCIWCYNLRNRKYCINNIQYTEEEYKQIIASKAYVKHWLNKGIKKILHNIKIENCFWNWIRRSNNIAFWFDVFQTNGAKYAIKSWWKWSSDYYDTSYQSRSEYVIEGVSWMWYWLMFTNLVTANSSNVLYSDLCYWIEHCFWCIGLRNKQYCIFNKQYTKEDYEIMVWKIIRHMMSTDNGLPCPERWEFFHPSLSPFWYNETVAQEYYPIEIQNSKLKIQNWNIDYSQFWYSRSTYSSDPKIPDGVKTIDCRQPEWAEDSEQWKQLNQITVGTHGNASVVGDSHVCDTSQQNYDICKQIILCEISWRPFMLQKAEIDFYRKHSIYLPRKHPDIRHEERMKLRPGRTLYLRNCDCCGKEMLSVYPVGTHGNASGLSWETSNANRVRSLDSEATDSRLASGWQRNNTTDSYLASGWQQQVYCESCYTKEIYG
jgi:hypothetical protein